MITLPANYKKLTSTQRKEVRLQYVYEQQGDCFYCKDPLDGPPSRRVRSMPIDLKRFPTGFLKNPVHLHYNHTNGLTIGAVHAYCNAVLWSHPGE